MYATLNLAILPAHILTVGLLLLISFIAKKIPPKFSDKSYGYRTRLSTKDEEIWDEANRYCSNLFFMYCVIFAAVDFFCYLFIEGPLSLLLPFFLFMLLLITLIFSTDYHIKKFDKKRKENKKI